MASSTGDWRRLADKVAARRGTLGLTQEKLAEAAGIEKRTLGSIERNPGPRRMTTLGGLERALGWAEGSIRQVLNGGEPVMADEYEIQTQQRGRKQTVIAKFKDLPDDHDAVDIIDKILDVAVANTQRRNAK